MWNARALAAGGSDTLRISPGSGLNVGTAMPYARPDRPAWSEPSPQARSSTSNLFDNSRERGDDVWVELRAGAAHHLLDRLCLGASGPIWTIGRDRAERVAGADARRGEGDRPAGEPVGIAVAVPVLVARSDEAPDVREQSSDALEHSLA